MPEREGPRGFCAGVERAIQIVERALLRFGPPVYVRHEIVHNKYVVGDLKAKGAIFVESLDQVPDGVPVYCGGVYPDRPFDPGSLELCSNESRPYATQSQRGTPVAPGERWTLLERRGGAKLPAACSPVTEITRSLRGETIVLSWVARC